MVRVFVVKSQDRFKARVISPILEEPLDITSPRVRLRKTHPEIQADNCEICGREDVIKYWNGSKTICMECSKTPAFALVIPEDTSIRTFKQRLLELCGMETLDQLPQIKTWIIERDKRGHELRFLKEG